MVRVWQISWDFTALRELEIALGLSDDITLIPPTQLKELTLSISKVASNRIARLCFNGFISLMHITRVFVSVHMDKSYGFIF